ncbi:MarR family transcriptional regulator [Ruegeria sp. HKCCD7255]|uniref:MarR family transcriptional regulator n=1 Tax=Ruegeria sp. HKCCD7255 TaxID=2683004 RepID=UPI001488B6AE|nr:MarR family transcriptional regulator [Ruegeria sp. HKCCD7255]
MTKPAPSQQRASLPPTRKSLPVSLILAREAVMAPIRKMLLKAGITEQQWRVLRVLSESGPMDAGNLAKRAGLMSPSLTRIVQSMQNSGYVQRETDADDRRRHHIAITSQGQAIIDTHLSEAIEIAEHYRTLLGDKDHDKLLTLLQKLADKLQDQDRP